MNFIERIKKLFRNKEEIKQEQTTTLSLYDVSDIILPDYNNLSNEDKEKVLKYKNNINVSDLKNIINYDKEISLKGENISKQLIKYLYELNEEIRKDDKTENELQEININTSIKNMKIIVLKEKIEKLLYESYLRSLAIEKYKEDYLKKENKFIEIFSRAARIKKNMELRSINEAEIRSKITIKTINQQYKAITNAINNNNTLVDKMDIYNKLNNDVIKDNLRRKIYMEKLEYFVDVKKYLNVNFSELNKITNLLKLVLNSEIEQDILKKIAITELELEEFIEKNKDEKVQEFLLNIAEYVDNNITNENINEIYMNTEKYKVYIEVLKDYIPKTDIDYFYKLRFNLLTYNINNKIDINSNFSQFQRKDIYHELDYYKNILSKLINEIYQGNSIESKRFDENDSLGKVLKLLNEYLKENKKFDFEKILFSRQLLALVLAFHKKNGLEKFFTQYKSIINNVCVPYNYRVKDGITLQMLYILYEATGENKPMFYDLYKLYQKVNTSDRYHIPEGIIRLTNDERLYKLSENVDNKKVIFPASLESISGGYIFGNASIKDIELNNGLKCIGNGVFLSQEFDHISIPKTIEKIKDTAFNFMKIKEIEFQDFKNSKLLYNLLYSNNEWVKELMTEIFRQSYSEDYRPYIECSLSKIVLCDDDNIIELTKSDILNCINYNVVNINNNLDKVQSNLSNLIEQETGINIKEYQENSYKQKK